jgi:hypothetical protein
MVTTATAVAGALPLRAGKVFHGVQDRQSGMEVFQDLDGSTFGFGWVDPERSRLRNLGPGMGVASLIMTWPTPLVILGDLRRSRHRFVINLMQRTGTGVSSSGGYRASYFRVMNVIAHDGKRHGVRQTEGNIMTMGSTAA